MKIGTMIRPDPGAEPHDRLLGRMADYARRIEAAGFPGIWVGDSLGRGRPTLDPLIELTVFASVTSKVELGISVLQLPLRNPIELAHRVQSVQALSANRLRLGVGSGSTRADFELLGYAKEYQGWTPSGRYSSWDDLEHGMRIYREAGGTHAELANVGVDLSGGPDPGGLAEVATSLVCPPDEARRRIKRMEQLGFDEVLLVSHGSVLEDIQRVRDFV